VALFERRDKLAAMGAEGAGRDVDALNDAVYERHRDDSAQEVLEYFRDAHRKVMEVLRRQTDADFERPYKTFFDPGAEGDEQPVLEAVAGNTYDHYADHLRWIKEQLG
jgi:2-polyprenyl-6-methoxyphenol hydroxylase-like FAD-dependent oxidoreductase